MANSGGMGTLAARKAGLREATRARRRAIAQDTREAAAVAIANALSGLPELADARLVLGYGANREELDPARAVARLRERGVRIAYPRVTSDNVLDLHEVGSPDELVLGSYSIREPRPESPRVDANEIDVVLVPGVAFDRRGYRLGYGGGFYDRFLARLPEGPLRIGLAFDEQLLDEVPTEPHDQPVDLVVTPSTVVHVVGAQVPEPGAETSR